MTNYLLYMQYLLVGTYNLLFISISFSCARWISPKITRVPTQSINNSSACKTRDSHSYKLRLTKGKHSKQNVLSSRMPHMMRKSLYSADSIRPTDHPKTPENDFVLTLSLGATVAAGWFFHQSKYVPRDMETYSAKLLRSRSCCLNSIKVARSLVHRVSGSAWAIL